MLIALTLLLPALAGGALLCSGRRLDRSASMIATVVAAVVFALDLVLWRDGSDLVVPFLAFQDMDFPFYLSSTKEGAPFATLAAGVGLAIFAYSGAFLDRDAARGRYFGWMLVFLAGITGLSFAKDILSALIGFEFIGLASWSLIGFWYQETDRARDANRAFIATRVGDLGLYVAAMAAFVAVGDFRFEGLGEAGTALRPVIAAGLVVAALGKSAQLPFTGWLSGAMSGPSPVSAYLHSATLLAAGPLLLTKAGGLLQATPAVAEWVLWIGVATALIASLIALLQEEVKQLLAASSAAQFGFIFAAIGAGSLAAGDVHLFEHGFFKAALFLVAGLFVRRGLHAFHELGGVGRRLRPIAVFALIAAAALGGVPPFGGFFTKDKILVAVEAASGIAHFVLLATVALTAAYATRFWLSIFGGSPRTAEAERLARPAMPIRLAIGGLAFASLIWGLVALPPLENWFSETLGAEAMPPFKLLDATYSVVAVGAGVGWMLLLRSQRRLVPFAPHGLRVLLKPAETWFGAIVVLDFCGRATVALGRILDRVDRIRPADRIGGFVRRLSGVAATSDDRGLTPASIAWPTMTTLVGSRRSAAFDVVGIDGAIRALDDALDEGAGKLRRAQSGLLHRYYVLASAGSAALFAVALWVLRF
ncbi:NADH-quinone oxidoreductase subunit 5 family protein [Aurantimonas marina]|uniref:NADH-quinone oxidoreductase subunit 5 family protein n=1 Tax=Aurantimonas marina TaxID=2780508 RepID=UPI0019D30B66|nr:proton-conducting transporter membrane subunit [Aurantimonas marina]